jgi:hypothetical protein
LLRLASLDLVVHQAVQKLLVAQVVVDGFAQPKFERLQHATQAKLLEQGHEIINDAHG